MNNLLILLGRLTKDPELSYTPNTSTAICRFTVAVDRKDKNHTTDFIPCKAIGKTAENIDKWFNKGKPILVQGRYTIDKYTDKKTGDSAYYTYCLVETWEFVPNEKKDENEQSDIQSNETPDMVDDGIDDFEQVDESVPF